MSTVADAAVQTRRPTSRYPRGLYGTNNKLPLVVITFSPSIWRPSSPGAISICPSESQTVSQLPTARVHQRWRTRVTGLGLFESIARAERTVGKNVRSFPPLHPYFMLTACFMTAEAHRALTTLPGNATWIH